MVVNSTLMGLKLLLLVAGVVGMKGEGRRKLKNQGLTKQLQEAGTEIKEITTMGNLQDTITTITETATGNQRRPIVPEEIITTVIVMARTRINKSSALKPFKEDLVAIDI